MNILATKSDISLLKNDIVLLQKDVVHIRKEIAESKVDIIKWLIATSIAIIGLVVTLVKLL